MWAVTFDYRGELFFDHDGWRVRVGRGYRRHQRGVAAAADAFIARRLLRLRDYNVRSVERA